MAFSMSGIVVIDKPQGITSHDVVAAVRKKLGTRKVGHAGTLDPMATGVLVIGVNQATRLLDFIVAGIKEYEATVRLGQSTVSDDADGEVVASSDASHLTDAEILAAFSPFQGKISQLPSKVSAKKIDGKRAHELVREGVEFELKPKDVEIFELEVKEISRNAAFVDVKIRVKCSAGTYIRSIARDAGENLKVGGHLIALRRSLVAPFDLSLAQNLESDLVLTSMYAATTAVLPTFEVTRSVALEITFGKPLASDLVSASGISAITFNNRVMAIVEKSGDPELTYRAVLTTELED
jgi:tRNA pseudouridine55 synthase